MCVFVQTLSTFGCPVWQLLMDFEGVSQKGVQTRRAKNIQIKGQLSILYNEDEAAEYMKNEKIELYVDIGTGKRNFEAYTMDLTKKYIEINADYRT